MANQTITLKSQPVRAFGPAPSTKWGSTFNWTAAGVGPGNGTWGAKSAGSFGSQPIIKAVFMVWTKANSCPVSGFHPVRRNPNKVFSKPLIPVWSVTDKEQSDGKGYIYLFPDRTTNAENRFNPNYTNQAAPATTYTSQAVGSASYVCSVV